MQLKLNSFRANLCEEIQNLTPNFNEASGRNPQRIPLHPEQDDDQKGIAEWGEFNLMERRQAGRLEGLS
jgi:hypothetical protein